MNLSSIFSWVPPKKWGKKTDFISRPFFTIAANMYGMLG